MLLRALVLLLHPFLGKQKKCKVWVALQAILIEDEQLGFVCKVAILKVQSKTSYTSHVRVNISSINKPVASISIFCDSPFMLCSEFKI
jgi:hypothetical protein